MKKTTNYFVLKDYLYLAIAVLVSLTMLFSNNSSFSSEIKSWSLLLFDQVLPDFFNPLKTAQLQRENIYLKDAMVRLYQHHNEYFDLKQENRHLRQMLDLQQKNTFSLIYARVLSRNPDKYPSTLLINSGWQKGVAINDIAVNANGLIGVVTECSRDYARVLMISSPKSRIAVRTEKGRVPGVLYPLDEEHAEVKEITKTQQVDKYEKVVTSAFSTIYPDGLEIGTIRVVSDSLATAHKYLKVRYSVNFTVLDDLFIMKNSQTADSLQVAKGVAK